MFTTETSLAYSILDKYYPSNHPARKILLTHSYLVRDKSIEIAIKHPELNADQEFITEAALLHDIGIFLTDAPSIGCHGKYPYICHGYLGREILEREDLPQHALVCERHTGTGLTAEEIVAQQLPVPYRNMVPETIEEKIICFADTFFSKGKDLETEKSPEEAKKVLKKYGGEKVEIFSSWCKMFL
jgi:uncharacterized protein